MTAAAAPLSAAPASAQPLLEAERLHLRHTRDGRDVVRDVSLAVEAGRIVALVGPNGCGKSTLLAALGRELRPRMGRIRLGGQDVRRISRRRFARRVARLPQEPSGPEGVSVEALVSGGRHPHVGLFAVAGADDRAAVLRALHAMDLDDLRNRELQTLSGGERRRAWIAMVLAQEPELLLLDEPTAALDLRHQEEVLGLLARESRERGLALVVSLHDLEHAARLAHELAVLHRGRLYALGPPERCLDEAMLRDVFGVEARISKEDGRWQVRVVRPADVIRSL